MTIMSRVLLVVITSFNLCQPANSQVIMIRNDIFLKRIEQDCRENNLANIQTMEVEYDYFRIMAPSGKEVTSDVMKQFLDKLVAEWNIKRDPSKVVLLTKELPIPQRAFPNCWLSGKVTQQGENGRVVYSADKVSGAFFEKSDTSFFEGTEVRYLAESRQASIFPCKSTWKMESPKSIFHFLSADSVKDLKIQKIVNSIVHIAETKSSFQIDLNAKSSMRSFSWGDRHKNGKQILQIGFSQYTGSNKDGEKLRLTLPSITANIDYQDGVVRLCQLYVIKSIQFNHKLPANCFHVPIPIDTNAVLFDTAVQRNPVAQKVARFNEGDARTLFPHLLKQDK